MRDPREFHRMIFNKSKDFSNYIFKPLVRPVIYAGLVLLALKATCDYSTYKFRTSPNFRDKCFTALKVISGTFGESNYRDEETGFDGDRLFTEYNLGEISPWKGTGDVSIIQGDYDSDGVEDFILITPTGHATLYRNNVNRNNRKDILGNPIIEKYDAIVDSIQANREEAKDFISWELIDKGYEPPKATDTLAPRDSVEKWNGLLKAFGSSTFFARPDEFAYPGGVEIPDSLLEKALDSTIKEIKAEKRELLKYIK